MILDPEVEGLTPEQYQVLLKDLSRARVKKRKGGNGKDLSYLEAYDVKAHLIRIFGFGGWSWNVRTAEVAFEEKSGDRWNVGYKVVGTLYIRSLGCEYAEAAVGSSILSSRGEAHDMAIKTAESDALKRAAINLGTQFGLSLYNNGDTNDVVKHSLVSPIGNSSSTSDEITTEVIDGYVQDIANAADEQALKEIYDACVESEVIELISSDGETVRAHVMSRLHDLRADDSQV